MAGNDTIEQFESRLRHAERFVEFFDREAKTAQQQKDYWESVVVQTQEKLYNLRHGDVPCPPTNSEG